MKTITKIISSVAISMGFVCSTESIAQTKVSISDNSSMITAEAFKINMRKLSEDDISWTRNIILCIVDNVPGQEATMKRLNKNQAEIGNAIKPYFGDALAKEFTDLMKAHVSLTVEVVKQAKAKNDAGIELANKKWYANAAEFSVFLRKLNPMWALSETKQMMYDHLQLTAEEAELRLNKFYDAEILVNDKLQMDMLEMSDKLAENIIKQFPAKFKPEVKIFALK